MPKNKKGLGHILHFLRVYGLNAIFGFGLGVVIVLFAITALGRPGAMGTEAKGINKSNTSNPINNSQTSPQSEGSEQGLNLGKSEEPGEVGEEKTLSDVSLKNRFTVLLVGMDNRPEEQFMSNTDSLIVASFDQKNKKMVLLSIPRDTQVLLPGKGKEKVNALARLGNGIPSTMQFVQELIGTPIDGYVMTNFQGFKNIVDSLGGITINVEKNMYFDTGDNKDRYIDLKKGTQRLNGTQALQYARFRNDELADITRTSRQQEVLKAMVSEATETRNLPKIPFLIPKISQSIKTNLNMSQLWALAMVLKNREDYEVINQTLPGKFSVEEGISYWKVEPRDSTEMLSKLFLGKKSPVFGYNASSATQKKPSSVEIKSSSKPEDKQKELSSDKVQPNSLKPGEALNEGTEKTQNHENQGITFEVVAP